MLLHTIRELKHLYKEYRPGFVSESETKPNDKEISKLVRKLKFERMEHFSTIRSA